MPEVVGCSQEFRNGGRGAVVGDCGDAVLAIRRPYGHPLLSGREPNAPDVPEATAGARAPVRRVPVASSLSVPVGPLAAVEFARGHQRRIQGMSRPSSMQSSIMAPWSGWSRYAAQSSS